MAVSHIADASTSKIRSSSTSPMSHADCASSSSSCPGPPARVSGDDARARRRPLFEDAAQQLRRRRQVQPLLDGAVLGDVGLIGDQDPAALGLNRSADVEAQVVAARDRRLQPHHLVRRHVRRAIQDQPERAVRTVVAEQHDRPREVRVLHLRHRQQQRRLEILARHHGISRGNRSSGPATNRRISSRRASSSGARRIEDG